MRKLTLNNSFGKEAFYVTSQQEADEVVMRILNEMDYSREQIFADTEVAPHPDWRHEFRVETVKYKPGLDPFKSQVRLTQIGWRDTVWVFDLFHCKDFAKLRLMLEHPDIWKWFNNGKYDYKQLLWSCDIVTDSIVDFMAAAKLLNLDFKNLRFLLEHYTGVTLDKSQRVTDWGAEELSEDQLVYAAEDVAGMMAIRDQVVKELKAKALWSAFSIECGAIAPAAEMELNGMYLDREEHKLVIDDLRITAANLQSEIWHDLSPHYPQMHLDGGTPDSCIERGVNLGSHKQLLAILQKAGLDIDATNKAELKTKALDHPITGKILKYKEAQKRDDSFGDSLLEWVHPITGRIHCDFNNFFTVTYRFSASHPNLQQIPRGKAFRRMFRVAPGFKKVLADYSAIEMIGAGFVAKDERLLNIFRKRLLLSSEATEVEKRECDPHYVTAGIVTGKGLIDVVKTERQDAKPVNFGFVYGQSANGFRTFALVQYDIAFTAGRASDVRDKYFSDEGYAGLARWHKHSKYAYKSVPDVRTIAGYNIPLSYNPDFDSFAGPAVLNYQVQNPCAAGNKRALKLLWRRYRPYMNKAARWTGPMLTATIHDENHLDAPEHMADEAALHLAQDMKSGMDKIFGCDDLVHVEGEVGDSWADKG